jgi:hypothetical protein
MIDAPQGDIMSHGLLAPFEEHYNIYNLRETRKKSAHK